MAPPAQAIGLLVFCDGLQAIVQGGAGLRVFLGLCSGPGSWVRLSRPLQREEPRDLKPSNTPRK